MVEPTYFLACMIFQDAGFAGKLRGVPENEHGIDTFSRAALEKFENESQQNGVHAELNPAEQCGKIFRHIFFLAPMFLIPARKHIRPQFENF